MMKKRVFTAVVLLLSLTLLGVPGFAQMSRHIIPSPRLTIEAIDPVTGAAKESFCIGPASIDVKLSNNSASTMHVTLVNRDTRGIERRLYTGQIPNGVSYLSRLLGTQLSLTGPEGRESLRLESSAQWQDSSNQVSYYVRNCGGQGGWSPDPGYGYATVAAQVQPYAIEQGRKGTMMLQSSVGYQQGVAYYFEILNSWGQLWKRIPVTKPPFAQYQVVLPVGKKTRPGILTYTVNLLAGPGHGGEQKLGSTRVSFRVIKAGSAQPPYNPGYPGYPTYPGYVDVPYGWSSQNYYQGGPQSPMYSSPSSGLGYRSESGPDYYGYYGAVGPMGSVTAERQID